MSNFKKLAQLNKTKRKVSYRNTIEQMNAKEFVKHQVNGIISENSTKSLYSSLECIFTQGDLLLFLKKNCKQNKLKHSNQALEEFKLIL